MSVNGTKRPVRSVALIVVGSLIGLIGLAMLAGGGFALWADQTQRDSTGYFTGSTHEIASDSYAVTHDDIGVHHLPGFVDDGKLVRIRIDAHSQGGGPLFVGVARDRDVDAYLTNVAHSNLRDYDVATEDQEYDSVGGTARPAPPAAQSIWVASGTGAKPLTWRLREGDWAVVLMNADGSKGVAANVKFGAKIGYLAEVTAGLLVAGALSLALAVFLIMRGGRRRGDAEAVGDPSPVTRGDAAAAGAAGVYPAVLTAKLDEPLSRGLWLVKWLLAIPHFIVLTVLWLAFLVLTVVAWLAVVITGRYPRGIFNFNLGVLRWTWRVSYYGYGALGTDRYPPFSLDAEPEYPATLDVVYPVKQSRLTAFGRLLLALPQLLIVGVFVGGGAYWIDHASRWHVTSPWSGLVGLLVLVAAVALLFTGRYPRGLFDLVIGLNRWVLRVVAYTALMTDEYPPFRLASGGEEPQAAPATAASPQF
jgi:Domain of unknown function (DUF4389)